MHNVKLFSLILHCANINCMSKVTLLFCLNVKHLIVMVGHPTAPKKINISKYLVESINNILII